MAIFAPRAHRDGSSIGLHNREWTDVITQNLYTSASIINGITVNSGALGLQADGHPILISPYDTSTLQALSLDEGIVPIRLNNLMVPSGDYSLNEFRITDSGLPIEDGDLTSKLYVDNLLQGIKWKQSVVCASEDLGESSGVEFWRSFEESSWTTVQYRYINTTSIKKTVNYRDTSGPNNGLGRPGWMISEDNGTQRLTFKIPNPYHENYREDAAQPDGPHHPRGTATETSLDHPGWTSKEYSRSRIATNLVFNSGEGRFTWRDEDTTTVTFTEYTGPTDSEYTPVPSDFIVHTEQGGLIHPGQSPAQTDLPTTDFSEIYQFNKQLLDNIVGDNSDQTQLKIGDRILIKSFKDETIEGGLLDMRPYNGIWEVVHTGSAMIPTDHDGDGDLWDHPDYNAFPILQRTLDFNSGSEISSAAVFVEEGVLNKDISYVVTTNSSSIGNQDMGTFPIEWTVYGTTYVDQVTIYKDILQNERIEVTGVLRDINDLFYDYDQNTLDFLDPEMGSVSYFNSNTGRANIPDGTFLVGDGTTFTPERGNTARTSLGLGTGSLPTFHSLTLQGDNTLNGVPGALTASVLIGQSNYYSGKIKLDAGLSGSQYVQIDSLSVDNNIDAGGNIDIGGSADIGGNITVDGSQATFGSSPNQITFNSGLVTIGSSDFDITLDDGKLTTKNIETQYLTASVNISSSYLQLHSYAQVSDYTDLGYPTNQNSLFVVDGGLRWNNLPVAGGSGVGGQEKENVQFWGGNIYSNATPPALDGGAVGSRYLRIGVSGSNTDSDAFSSSVERGDGRRILEGSFVRLSGSNVDIDQGTLDNVDIGYGDTGGSGQVSRATLNSITGSIFRFNSTENDVENVITGSQAHFSYINATQELTASSVDINGGTLDNVNIGSSIAGNGVFTNLTASNTVNFENVEIEINGAGGTSNISNVNIDVTSKTLTLDAGQIDASRISGASDRSSLSADDGIFNPGYYSFDGSIINAVNELTGTYGEFQNLTASSQFKASTHFELISTPTNRGLIRNARLEDVEIVVDALAADTGSFTLLSSSHLIVNDTLESDPYIDFYLDGPTQSQILGVNTLHLEANRVLTTKLSGSTNNQLEYNLVGINNSAITGSHGKFTNLEATNFSVTELTASSADINGGTIDNVLMGRDVPISEITASHAILSHAEISETAGTNFITASYVKFGHTDGFNNIDIVGNKSRIDESGNHGSLVDVGYITSSHLLVGDTNATFGGQGDGFVFQIMGGTVLTASSLGSRGNPITTPEDLRSDFFNDSSQIKWGYNYLQEVRTPSSTLSGNKFFSINRNYFDNHSVKRTVRLAINAIDKTDSDFADYRAGQSAEGETLIAGDRILLYNSQNPYVNGIWVVDAAGITRAEDFRAGNEVTFGVNAPGAFVSVLEGSNNSESIFICKRTSAGETAGQDEVPYRPSSNPATDALIDFIKISDSRSVFVPEEGLTFKGSTNLLKVDIPDGEDPITATNVDGPWINLTFDNNKLVLSSSIRVDKLRSDSVQIGGNLGDLGSVANVVGSIDSTEIGLINPRAATFTILSASQELRMGNGTGGATEITASNGSQLTVKAYEGIFDHNITSNNDITAEGKLIVGDKFRVNNLLNGSNIQIDESYVRLDDIGAKPSLKTHAFYNFGGDLYWENVKIADGGTAGDPNSVPEPSYASIYITGSRSDGHHAYFSSSLVINEIDNTNFPGPSGETSYELYNNAGDLYWNSGTTQEIIHSGSNIDISEIEFTNNLAPYGHTDNRLVNVTGSLYWTNPSDNSTLKILSGSEGGSGGTGNSPFTIEYQNGSTTNITVTDNKTYISIDLGTTQLTNRVVNFPGNAASGDELTLFIYRSHSNSTLTFTGATTVTPQDQIIDFLTPGVTPKATSITDIPVSSMTSFGFVYAAAGDPDPFAAAPGTLSHGLWLLK